MIRAAVFDLDGTLVDSQRDLALAVNHALGRLGLPERPTAEIAAFVGGGARLLVERAVAPRADLVEEALRLWWEHYQVHLLDHTVLYPRVAELLRDARLPMAVHTNKPGALARRILEGLGVLGLFAEVVGGDEAPRKPDPTGTRALLARLGVRPEDGAFVGDSAIDAETARAVPMRFVGVTWGLHPAEELLAAGAATMVRGADELRPLLGAPPGGDTPPGARLRVTLEEKVAGALRRGDPQAAATEAIRGLGPEILGYLTRLLGSPEDAADAFSFFAEDLWQGIASFRGDAPLRVWAYRIAWNCSARVRRGAWRRRRERFPSTMASRLAAEVCSRSPASVERKASLLDGLRRELTREEQSLLVLRLDRQLSWKEVAQVMATAGGLADEAALRKRFERIKERLEKRARESGLID